MARITIEYDEGTVAHWTRPDDEVEALIEPVLGVPESMRA